MLSKTPARKPILLKPRGLAEVLRTTPAHAIENCRDLGVPVLERTNARNTIRLVPVGRLAMALGISLDEVYERLNAPRTPRGGKTINRGSESAGNGVPVDATNAASMPVEMEA